jgi:hypothetical protein
LDTLAHAVYGATLFSRAGLAGGRRGASTACGSYVADWTVWVAAGFGALPDLSSIGPSFVQMVLRGDAPSFHAIPPHVMLLYRLTHSLVVAGLIVLLLRRVALPLAVPALAWPVHVVMDSFSHGDGHWQTLLFYPLSEWHFHGLNWWEHRGMMLAYWGALPTLWLFLYLWRRARRAAS